MEPLVKSRVEEGAADRRLEGRLSRFGGCLRLPREPRGVGTQRGVGLGRGVSHVRDRAAGLAPPREERGRDRLRVGVVALAPARLVEAGLEVDQEEDGVVGNARSALSHRRSPRSRTRRRRRARATRRVDATRPAPTAPRGRLRGGCGSDSGDRYPGSRRRPRGTGTASTRGRPRRPSRRIGVGTDPVVLAHALADRLAGVLTRLGVGGEPVEDGSRLESDLQADRRVSALSLVVERCAREVRNSGSPPKQNSKRGVSGSVGMSSGHGSGSWTWRNSRTCHSRSW